MTSVVLEEEFDEAYEPTEEEILEYAKFLGMDPDKEKHLLWIARESLKAPLPEDWKPCQTEDGNIYYFNFKTGESMWDHPSDEHYRKLYQSEREKAAKGGAAAATGSSKPDTQAKERAAPADAKPNARVSTKSNHLGSIVDLDLSDDGEDESEGRKTPPALARNSNSNLLHSGGKSVAPLSAIPATALPAKGSLAPIGDKATAGAAGLSLKKKDSFDDEDFDDDGDDFDDADIEHLLTDSGATKDAKNESKQSAAPASTSTVLKSALSTSLSSLQTPGLHKSSSKSSLKKVSFGNDGDGDDDFDLPSDESVPAPPATKTAGAASQANAAPAVPAAGGSTKPALAPLGPKSLQPLSATGSAVLASLTVASEAPIMKDLAMSATATSISRAAEHGTMKLTADSRPRDIDSLDGFDSESSDHSASPPAKSHQVAKTASSSGHHDKPAAISAQANRGEISPPGVRSISLDAATPGDKGQASQSLKTATKAVEAPAQIEKQAASEMEANERRIFEARQSELRQTLQAQLDSVKRQHDIELANLRSSTEAEIESARRDAKKQLEDEITWIRTIPLVASTQAPFGSDDALEMSSRRASLADDAADPRLRKMRLEFEKNIDAVRAELARAYADRKAQLQAAIEREFKLEFERAERELREQAAERTKQEIARIREQVDTESKGEVSAARATAAALTRAADAALESVRAAHEQQRLELEQRTREMADELRRKEAENAEVERKLNIELNEKRLAAQRKIAQIESEIQAAGASATHRPPKDGERAHELEKLRSETDRAIAEYRERRLQIDRDMDEIARREREISGIKSDTERAMQEERERRRKVDALLDDVVRQERDARTRLDAVIAEANKQEVAARAKYEAARDDAAKMERDLRSRQALLKQDMDACEREHRDVEMKRERIRDETRQMESQASLKRQVAIELGPLERDVDQRRQDLVREKMQLDELESEIKVRRQRLEDDKFRLSLTEKEIVLLRRQLDDEKRTLEMTQADLVAERRNLSALRASVSMGNHSRHGSSAQSAAHVLCSDRLERAAADSVIGDSIGVGAEPLVGRDADGRRSRSRSHRRHRARPSMRSNSSTSESERSQRENVSNSSRGSRSGSSAGLVSDSDDFQTGKPGGKLALAQLNSRIKREERELKRAKKFLKMQCQDIDERFVEFEENKRVWDVPTISSSRDWRSHPSAARFGPVYRAAQIDPGHAPAASHKLAASASAPSAQIHAAAAVPERQPQSRLEHRSESLDEISGELSRLLDVLKEQSKGPSPNPARRDTASIEHILESHSASYIPAAPAIASRPIGRSLSPSRAAVLPRSSSLRLPSRTGGGATLDRTRAWVADHKRGGASLHEHSEWLKRFAGRHLRSNTEMDALDKCQIMTHSTRSLPYTAYDVRWVPSSPRFVVLGQLPRGAGILEVCQLSNGSIVNLQSTEKPHAFKCSTFGASSLTTRHLATGDFGGRLCMWDLERIEMPVFSTVAHDQIISCIDGCGGTGVQTGPPELATGSRDGAVKIWDVRQRDKPVAKIAPGEGEPAVDTWAVSFGNSFNDEERCVCAGYENGDVKLFDLRAMKLLWETNLKNGVCSAEFDRKDIKMNKLVVAGLESKVHVFDMRTQHPKEGFASVTEKAADTTTVWTVRHLPQNRDVFLTTGGSGSVNLYRYKYPSKRSVKAKDDAEKGVPGTIELVQNAHVAEQPVGAFDWSPDKMGLFVFAAFDQAVRVGFVSRLNQL
ncbi:hypothetical protein HK105_200730 [Polyrhizophydium stewartii]|uniref:WW domain-containing protein n=1 Tax=Polyrhizophydium stewartii TaxID=2732419 RepID=A0ABR4NJV7_9FUNG